MLNKNDPLIGAVQEVMKKNQAEREAAKIVNEAFGVEDRKALPHELQGEWDAAYKTVLTEGAEALDEDWDSKKRDKAKKIEAGAKKIRANRQGHIKDFGKMIANRTRQDAVTGDDTAGEASKAMKYLYGKNKSDRVAIKKISEEETLDEKVKMTKKEFANLDGDPKFTANDLAHARAGTHKKKAASGKLEENNLDEAGMMPTGIKRVLAGLKAGWLANKHNNRALGDDPYQRTPPENYEKDINQAIKYRRIEKRLRKEDVTSPSSMGISKPDYAPAGTKPDYAVRKTVGPKSDLIKKPTMSSGNSTVTQTGKTSSSATKSTMKESKTNPYAIGMAAVQKSTGDKPPMEKKNIKKAHEIAKKIIAEKKMNEGFNNRHGMSVTASAEKQAVAEQTLSPRQNHLDQVEMRRSIAAKRQQELAQQRLKKKNSTQGFVPLAGNSAVGNSGIGQVNPDPDKVARSNSLANKRKRELVQPVVTASNAAIPAKVVPIGGGNVSAPVTASNAAVPKPVAKPVQAASKPVAAAPVKNASTRGGTMTQRNANLLARAKAGGGQKLSTTFKSGKDRLAFFAARNAERRGP